jgi:predicted transposase YbfD/YdcC
MAAWGRNDGTRMIAQALGFTHGTPCAATLHTILRHVNRDECEARLGTWADSVAGNLPTAPETPEVAMALDGKTLRGSTKQGAPGTHLLSALMHHGGVTLANQAVDDKTNEITAVETILQRLVLEGRMVTMDALLTQRQVAQTIVDKGGNYGMIVKENQSRLRAAIALVFTLPPVGDRQATARTIDLGHGRIEPRNITTSETLVGYSDWPGLAQVFALGRHVILPKTGEERVEGVYGITSLRPERATPERLLALVQGQWQIAHKSHWVRDVTFDEDRSQVRFPRDVEQCCFRTPREIETLIKVQALFIVLGDECEEGHDLPLFTRAVCADNTCGDGADGLPGPQIPHTRASDSTLVPENRTRTGACADTPGLALPALLPRGVGSPRPVPASAPRPRAH